MRRYFVISIVLFYIGVVICSRIRIENNAYKDILIALPKNVEEEDRPRIVRGVEDMLRSSSVILQGATKGRAYFSTVSVIIPDDWNVAEDEQISKSSSFNVTAFSNPRASLTIDEADVVVTEKGQHPYVLHQDGCGKRSMRIILPSDFVLRNKEKGVEFARLWSEYRYGVFPEGGFQNDEKYPFAYKLPNEQEEKTTGCPDKTFWSSNLCNEGDKQCALNSMTSSLMDQHLPSANLFCEGYVSLGPKHNTESPSKHNLLCKEEGTWFTVAQSPDFTHGKNAAPKYLQHATDVSFRYVLEAVSPRVIVAIDISSRMGLEWRYVFTQAAFYHFVYSTLPFGSEVTLFVFGDEEGARLLKEGIVLESEDSRILYVELQPLPEETSNVEDVSLSQIFDEIFLLNEKGRNESKSSSSIILMVTTESQLNESTYTNAKQKLSESESRLHVMVFPEGEKTDEATLMQDLCNESGGEFISLQTDSLRDLYRGFGKSIGSFNNEIQIMQDYLSEDFDVDLEVSFVVDESLTENLKVYLFFPYSDTNHLHYRKTILQTPSGGILNFMKLEFLFAWVVDLTKPEAGQYILKTRRVEDVTYPVLISVTGRASTSEDPLKVSVWAETITDVQVVPHPVRIYTEVRKGWNPVRGAEVTATVHHPGGKISELTLYDDGLGDVDITKHDGIYGRYFTDFTDPGFYNLYVKVSQGSNGTEILKGPAGLCCGSFFSSITSYSTGSFQREAGPFTFQVPHYKGSNYSDIYPPSRITDLRLDSRYDRICVLRWTAVGDNYDAGYAKTYELKIFRDSSIIRKRFSDTGQILYSETIQSAPEAIYGTTLNHAFELPTDIRGGMYYIAIRGVDEAGNAGESSNAVPLWIEEPSLKVDCESEQTICKNGECEKMASAEKLIQGNAAIGTISTDTTIIYISSNIVIPVIALCFIIKFSL